MTDRPKLLCFWVRAPNGSGYGQLVDLDDALAPTLPAGTSRAEVKSFGSGRATRQDEGGNASCPPSAA
jgi:hypothetical protein